MTINLNETWLSGKYKDVNAEINTSYSTLSIGDNFFAQGEEADTFISEIHQIWVNNDITIEDAILRFADMYDIATH